MGLGVRGKGVNGIRWDCRIQRSTCVDNEMQVASPKAGVVSTLLWSPTICIGRLRDSGESHPFRSKPWRFNLQFGLSYLATSCRELSSPRLRTPCLSCQSRTTSSLGSTTKSCTVLALSTYSVKAVCQKCSPTAERSRWYLQYVPSKKRSGVFLAPVASKSCVCPGGV